MKTTQSLQTMRFAATIILAFSFFNVDLFSQDHIYRVTGEMISAKVLEIGVNEITYKKYENQSGPTYKIPKSDVERITYENGSEDVFNDRSPAEESETISETGASRTDSNTPAPEKFRHYLMGGFNVLMHHGIYGSTVPARPDGGEFHPTGGDPYNGLGFGVNVDYHPIQYLAIHFDINNYRSSTPVAYSGGYATSDWVWEMNDYDQRLIGPFSENANYNINTTGMRLGIKIYPFSKSKLQPWYGIYYGYYNVNIGVYSEDKKSTYGNTDLTVTGMTYMNVGIDFWDKNQSFGGTLFFEGGSPVGRNYSIENCLHEGWTFEDYGEGFHIFGYYRVGVSMNFITRKKRS